MKIPFDTSQLCCGVVHSIDYEYWKCGKDRVRGSFNPDFFIRIDLDDYVSNNCVGEISYFMIYLYYSKF
jgi:hypothetical protein